MGLSRKVERFGYYLKNFGIKSTIKKTFNTLTRKNHNTIEINKVEYDKWLIANMLTDEEIEAQRKATFEYSPKISFVVPMYGTKKEYLADLINYLRMQTYTNWEVCLADGSGSYNEAFDEYVKGLDDRIHYKLLEKNLGIAGNTNEAIKMAEGTYIAFLDHDDIVPVDCCYEIVKKLNEDKTIDFIYTDEDKINDDYTRRNPFFKPDFSKEFLESQNYITHLVVVRRELLDKVGELNPEFDGAQDYDLVLRLSEKATNICHIPKILYHWRINKGSTALRPESKSYAYDVGKKVLESHYERINRKATVTPSKEVIGAYTTDFEIGTQDKVSIIIPNKDNIFYLDRCIKSIVNKTTYPNYEIIVVENNSTDKLTFKYYEKLKQDPRITVIYYGEKEFNYSKIINYGVKYSNAKYVLQLNNDTKVLTPNWLERFVGMCQYEDIGIVGARLYYSDKTIQHAGIAYGIKGTAGNLFVNIPKDIHGYYALEAVTRNVSAVTGACLFARKSLYEELGYMNEDLAVAFNDVDFCLKAREKGYRIVYNADIELIHYESKSRGYEDTEHKSARFEKEKEKFVSTWKKVLDKPDPYFNINFSRDYCEFIIRGEKVTND